MGIFPETESLFEFNSALDIEREANPLDGQRYLGGQSFVALQPAAAHGGPHGLLNFALYALSINGEAYSGRHPPLRDIRQGTNEGFQANKGYDQATGLGVLDVANLAAFFK